VKRKRAKTLPPSGARNDPAQAAPIPAGRRWCFRLLALLIPFLALGLLELGLRLAGYGHPTAFFLPVNDQGRAMLTDNPWFGWRFFPPAVARAPRPAYLAAQKPPGTVRIFVFGESAAMGDPEPAYGFARQLERLLQARHPDQQIEVVNAAMTAINSHVIRPIARDCEPWAGDFWLVLAGNNEVIGPFGAGTVFGRQTPGLAAVRASLALKSTRTGQWLAQLTRGGSGPTNWEGLEFFLGQQVAHDSPRLTSVYAAFAANLGDIADFGRRSGATVVLATMPVNLRDCPPFASVHRPDLRPDQLAEWRQRYAAGADAQTAGRFEEALADFHRAAELDDAFAELSFRRAACELALKQPAAAQTDFRRARDLDALRFRADSRINEIIRQTAARGIPLADAEAEFERHADENLFYDHVHFNFDGNYRLALLFAAEMERHWPGGRTNDRPWLARTEVARRLACTEFDERRTDGEMRARLRQPPFNAQSNFRARDERWGAAIAALSAPAADCVSNYLAAVALAPGDWLLHAGFARVLEAAGDRPGAAGEWTAVSRLLPHSAEAWVNLGRLASLAGDTQRARECLEEALRQQPDSAETHTELGIVAAGLGQTESARREFLAALRLQPGSSAARVNLGLLLAHTGDAAGAAAEYRAALRWNTNSTGARINLANLLTAQGQNAEALVLYEEAVNLEPENPLAHYEFGRLLAANGRAADAVTNLEAAVGQSPGMAEIHFELGNALARLGRETEALAEFLQAVRLKPDYADAHFNFGVALARSGRYAEAAAEFRETLRLRPRDERAQQMLDRANAMRGGGTH
jgi:tetratricopeptide (TPR) repeat protein